MTRVIHEGNTLDVYLLPIKSVLKESDDVIAYRVSCGETFRPGEDFTRIQSGLFDWKREGKTKGNNAISIHVGCRLCSQECVNGVGQII